MDKSGRAPVITVFDHRGCSAHANKEYTGPKANAMEDEQCLKVQSVKITGPDADTVLRDSLATLKKNVAFQSWASLTSRSMFDQSNTAMAAMDKSGRAPVITVFDHRGCSAHANKEYTGPKANSMEDEQCVKVQSIKINGPDADTVLRDSLATLKKVAFQSWKGLKSGSIFDQSDTVMSMETSRREVVQTGAATAVAA